LAYWQFHLANRGLHPRKVGLFHETSGRSPGKPTTATDILAALGRVPNTQGIGLEKAGIEITEAGHIPVNDRLETTAPNVWAVGESAGSPYFTHVSENDFHIIHANLIHRWDASALTSHSRSDHIKRRT
jgi:pyruvate/2-oxoglutarate dehydrogenase complex dihydrolipoamide dehydrogenase (E3) component